MNKKILTFVLAFMFFVFGGVLAGCESVVPCAWVKLDMEGYIYYSSRMYPGSDSHIQLYESEEEFHEQFSQTLLEINFFPRILGADDSVDDVRVTTVDVSNPRSVSIKVIVNKLPDNSLYSPEKKVYLNGEVLVSNPDYDFDSDAIVSWMFDNVPLVRGNTDGSFNGYINTIEYK